ncbi:hypothetical protein F4779DRAFT_616414 [Xylariaceae sp. FL0662B]|nr:hypothetical protein F4779DRAFT_616414 [Xylariaceae sp. FL0662B]
MCIEVWNRFRDADCHHRVYQNTFPCHIARRLQPEDDLILEHTAFLPTRPPKIPPGLLDCKRSIATRPTDGKCPECLKKARKAEKAKAAGTQAIPPSNSTSSMSSALDNAMPSVDAKAVDRMRNSLLLVAQKQRATPSSEWRELDVQNGGAGGS